MPFLSTMGFRLAAVAYIQAQSWRTVLICVKNGWGDTFRCRMRISRTGRR